MTAADRIDNPRGGWLAAATVDPSVLRLRPDYRVLLLTFDGLVPATGVTCRRWNWRQARRTALTDHTTSALFILDALAPLTDQALLAAADDLCEQLLLLGAGVHITRRLLGPTSYEGT